MIRPLLLLIPVLLGGLAQADAVITAVKSVQRAGTHKVDITYSLATPTPCSISVQVSTDGGATYDVAVLPAAFSGDIGSDISAGVRTIVLDAAATTTSTTTTSLKDLFTKQLRFKVVAVGPETDGFALIPAGSFQMGQDGIATPVHTVYVSGFHMGKYEVTKELWDTVRAWGVNNGYTDLPVGNGSYASKGANHPVHSIDWYSVVKWCNARSEKENLMPCYTVGNLTYKTGQDSAVVCNFAVSGYRLPTEAEWEKAARGGLSGKLFPWGNTITHNQANYISSNSFGYDTNTTRGSHPVWSGNNNGVYPYSSPVGSFLPEPNYGLYDIAGNMFEYCWDWNGTYTATSQNDPRGAPSGSLRALRGGSWYSGADTCRAADRRFGGPGHSSNFAGFRIARSAVP